MGVTLPSQPLPDWAMSQQQQQQQQVEQEPSKRVRTVRRAVPSPSQRVPDRTANASYTATGSIVTGSVARDDIKPFSPEWHSRENAADARLRRTMDICRGC